MKATSEYLNRRCRTLEQVLAQRDEAHARAVEIRMQLERAEEESKEIRDMIPMHLDACDRFDELHEAIKEIIHDRLAPAEKALEEME